MWYKTSWNAVWEAIVLHTQISQTQRGEASLSLFSPRLCQFVCFSGGFTKQTGLSVDPSFKQKSEHLPWRGALKVREQDISLTLLMSRTCHSHIIFRDFNFMQNAIMCLLGSAACQLVIAGWHFGWYFLCVIPPTTIFPWTPGHEAEMYYSRGKKGETSKGQRRIWQ